MSYSNPTTITYRFPAVSVISGATLGRFVGPNGMVGRLLDVAYVVTTGVTVAASNLIVGSAGNTGAYGTLAVPVAAANAVGNGMIPAPMQRKAMAHRPKHPRLRRRRVRASTARSPTARFAAISPMRQARASCRAATTSTTPATW